jgi:translocation and assembly module TamB
LEIGQNETGQTQLTTGKYLSENVYLEVRTASEGSPGLAVEWQVRDNISLEAETSPNERQRLSIQWKKDFD